VYNISKYYLCDASSEKTKLTGNSFAFIQVENDGVYNIAGNAGAVSVLESTHPTDV